MQPRSEFWATNMERLKELRSEGYSARRIAAILDPGGGITRNAVIGQLARHDAPCPKGNVRARQGVMRSRAAQTVTPLRLVPSEPAPIGPVRDFPKSGMCRFIHGDVRDQAWRCCGHASVSALSPWCEHHLDRVSAKGQAA